MKLQFTLALILSYGLLIGQSTNPSKEDIEKIINLTISQKISKKNISCEFGQCGEWWTANSNNIFYKYDTVKFYNSSNIVYNDSNFCTSLVWDFGKNKLFNETRAQMCQEPPTRTIKGGDFLGQDKVRTANRYKISSENNRTFIIILIDTKIFETFEVIGLEKTTQKNLGDKSYVLTLIRQKRE